nr:unnamed protein product [Callosobruchus chinensis]
MAKNVFKDFLNLKKHIIFNKEFWKTLGLFTKKNNYATEATFETKPCKLYRLEDAPPTSVTLNKEDAIRMYTRMHTIRRLETSAGSLYKEKLSEDSVTYTLVR